MTNSRDGRVHRVAKDVGVEHAARPCEVRTLRTVQVVRVVEDAEILGDPLPLNVGGSATPLYVGLLEVRRRRAVAAKRRSVWEAALKRAQVRVVEDEPLERNPVPSDCTSTQL